MGLTLTKGNSDTLLFSASADAAKKWNRNELSMGAQATYGENENTTTGEDEKNNETARGFIQYNRLISERAFGYARAELFHDAIARIDYRLSVSPGVGYYFIKEERTSLRGEVGPGFVYEKQGGEPRTINNPNPEGDETTGYFTLRLADRFEHKFNDRARVWQSAELLPQVDDFNNYLLNAEVGAEADLTEKLSLRVVLQDTYDNEPAEGRKKNDIKLITALALRF